MIELSKQGADSGNDLWSKEDYIENGADPSYFENCVWLVFRADLETTMPVNAFQDYNKLCEWIKTADGHGRFEKYELGHDNAKDDWDIPANSHDHFGFDPDAIVFETDFGDCECGADEDKEAEVKPISREEKVINGKKCTLEVFHCEKCGDMYAVIGVENSGVWRIGQSKPGEVFVMEEVVECAMKQKAEEEKDDE